MPSRKTLKSSRLLLLSILGVATITALSLLSAGGDFPAGAQTPPEPPLSGKPQNETQPDGATTNKDGWADEVPIGAETVNTCPLTPAGCEAANELLDLIADGDTAAVSDLLPGTFPIGGKPGMQILDQHEFDEALLQAQRQGTVAVGCPQENVLGPEIGACADAFVLSIDAVPSDRWALGFLFVREGDAFVVTRAAIEPYLNVVRGGGAATFALPLEVTHNKSALWYTPWER